MARRDSLLSAALLLLGVAGLFTGAFAYLAPTLFFEAFASYTGTANVHLVRDVGAAYLTAGGALTWAAATARWRAPLTVIAALFLALHAVAHVLDLVSGEAPLSHLLADLVQVLAPAALVGGMAIYFLRSDADGLGPGTPTA